MDVEQQHVGVELGCDRDRGVAVLGLADDLEALRLQDRTRRRSKAWVVVDDENACHVLIVAESERLWSTGNRTLFVLRPAAARGNPRPGARGAPAAL